jgi:hypothetical protein
MALPKLNTVLYDLYLPYSKKTIQYRPFVVGEQKNLMIAMETRDEKQILTVMKQAIQACTNNTIEVSSLPLFELEFLFLNIRMKSVGEHTKIVLACEKCLAENTIDVDLRNTEFTDLEKVKDGVILLTDNIAVRMKTPNIELVQRMKSEDFSDEKQVELMFNLTVNCIEAVLDKENEYPVDQNDQTETIEFVNSLSSDQFLKIQAWFENIPSLRLKVEHKCDNCGNAMETYLQGIANFF